MGDGRLLPAPLSDQSRCQRVAEIVETGMRTGPGNAEIPGETAKSGMCRRLDQRAATPSDEEPIGQRDMTAPGRPVAAECPHRGGVQG